MNNIDVKILIDSSGSMNERGVSSVLKYILNILKNNFNDLGMSYEFISINENKLKISEIKDLKFKGKLNEKILLDIIESENSKIIFLTDGDIQIDKLNLKEKNQKFYCLNLSKESSTNLKKICDKDRIYDVSEVLNLIKEI